MVFERARPDYLVARRFLNGGEKVRVAHAVDQRRIQARSMQQQTVHAPIRPLHTPIGIDRNHSVLHAVEQSFQLALAGLNASVTFFHAARRFIECRRHLPDLVRRSGSNSGGQIPARHALGKIHDPLQTPTHIVGSDRRHQHRENESAERSPEQRHAQRTIRNFDLGQRIRQSHRSSGNRRRHIQKGNAKSMTLAFIHADFAGKGGNELLALRVILHRARIGFRIGQHLAGGIDDGGAGSRRLALLGGNVGQGVLPVRLHAIGEHQGFLFEIALDLLAQGAFPHPVHGQLQRDRGYANHQQKHNHQFHEDAASQRATSKR